MRARHQVAEDPAVLRILLLADTPLLQRALTVALSARSDVVVTVWPGSGPVPWSSADVVVAVASGFDEVTPLTLMQDETSRMPLVVVSPAAGTLHLSHHAGEVVALDLDSSVAEMVDTAKALLRRSQLLRPDPARSRRRPRERRRVLRSPHDRLTAREREVLTLISSGTTTNQIADSLDISTHTARTHVRNILDKLEVNSRLQAGAYAARNRLV